MSKMNNLFQGIFLEIFEEFIIVCKRVKVDLKVICDFEEIFVICVYLYVVFNNYQ